MVPAIGPRARTSETRRPLLHSPGLAPPAACALRERVAEILARGLDMTEELGQHLRVLREEIGRFRGVALEVVERKRHGLVRVRRFGAVDAAGLSNVRDFRGRLSFHFPMRTACSSFVL